MRVLVGCEYSGTVRDAFLALGHDAVSCDLIPTEAPGPHLVGDVREHLGAGWDLAVFHPPCTYLANSGVRWLYTDPLRWQGLVEGATLFRDLLAAPIPRVAVENPVMHKWARLIVGERPSQTIQPWEYGHPETKRTALWLRGLPPLLTTLDARHLMAGRPKRETDRVHYLSPGPERGKIRSLTYPGIAQAMAEQWGAP